MRQANTTYVNLRSTLDELDPFVEASKPVATRLRPYLDELRPFAREARADRARPERADRAPPGRAQRPDRAAAAPTRRSTDIALARAPRTIDFGTGAADVGETPRRVPRAGRGARRSAPIDRPRAARTPPTSSAGSTTSRTPARYDALGSVLAARRPTSTRSRSRTGLPDRRCSRCPTAPTPSARSPSCARSSAAPAPPRSPPPDGSNVWSEEEQRELDCLEAHRATGAIDMMRRGRYPRWRSWPPSRRGRCSRARGDGERRAEDLRDRVRQRASASWRAAT